MKRIISLMTLALLAVLMPVWASSSSDLGDPVPLYPGTENPGTGHRIPALVPISCLYSDGVLTFTFSADLGTVECEVVRQSDLEVYDAAFQAVDGGSDSLYVSTDAGDYEITLTLSNGTAFYGEYTVE